MVRGRRADYFAGWLETADIESFVSGQSMQYGTDLDVTNYINKRRITLNPPPQPSAPQKGDGKGKKGKGKGATSSDVSPDAAGNPGTTAAAAAAGGAVVSPKFVWQKFREGCSLRMPCPQKYSDPLHRLLAALEEEFGCMVGSNVYLTPPRSQGFAPHWDDIEAFLLQVWVLQAWYQQRARDPVEGKIRRREGGCPTKHLFVRSFLIYFHVVPCPLLLLLLLLFANENSPCAWGPPRKRYPVMFVIFLRASWPSSCHRFPPVSSPLTHRISTRLALDLDSHHKTRPRTRKPTTAVVNPRKGGGPKALEGVPTSGRQRRPAEALVSQPHRRASGRAGAGGGAGAR